MLLAIYFNVYTVILSLTQDLHTILSLGILSQAQNDLI